jgi:hypothetical protein
MHVLPHKHVQHIQSCKQTVFVCIVSIVRSLFHSLVTPWSSWAPCLYTSVHTCVTHWSLMHHTGRHTVHTFQVVELDEEGGVTSSQEVPTALIHKGDLLKVSG